MAHAAVKHDYHLVDPSPWPLLVSATLFIFAIGLVTFMKGFVPDPANIISSFYADTNAAKAALAGGVEGVISHLKANADFLKLSAAQQQTTIKDLGNSSTWFWLLGKGKPFILGLGFISLCWVAGSWWADVVKEANKGEHTPVVRIGLKYGMILFIMSEMMFFVAWFWSFFEAAIWHDVRALSTIPDVAEAWSQWPPKPIHTVDPWSLPLLNTFILLLSGTTITWAHHCLLENDRKNAKIGLGITILLGIAFTCIQAAEYWAILHHEEFTFGGGAAGLYGSTFFMATGFHGTHVLIGTIFLIVCFIRLMKGDFTPEQHFGFEAAAWYWHFVDVVWLFLFAFIYVAFG